MTKTLDYLVAKTAQEIVEAVSPGVDIKELENIITKALGVLQAQGVYALFLYLYSQSGEDKPIKKAASHIVAKLWDALTQEPANQLGILKSEEGLDSWHKAFTQQPEIFTKIRERITADLDTLLFVRNLYEQTLIYARFHAKAAKE